LAAGKKLVITDKMLEDAWLLHRDGKAKKTIAKMINLSHTCYLNNELPFLRYFDRRSKEEARSRKEASKKPSGRPKDVLKLDKKINEDILLMAGSAGYSIERTAKILGVPKITLLNFLQKRPHMYEAFRNGREIANLEIIKALKKRACGMSLPDTKFATFEGEITDQKEYQKHFLPDVSAIKLWLVNNAGWHSENPEKSGEDRKGLILEAMQKMTQINKDEMEKFDNEE
jgi:hypothetical protein